jgi:putative salt-induced outer membrane protein YdiY
MRFIRILPAFVALTLMSTTADAARTDIALLVNGNAITGEIESYEFGSLEYGTDSMGTVSIDWEDIVGLTSNQNLQVEVSNGTRFLGNLDAAEDRFHINVITEHGPVELAMDRIVRITPIDVSDRFVKRLEGGISIGLNSQSGSGVTIFDTTADVRYRTEQYLVGLTLSSSITDQPSEETQGNHTARVNYQRFRPNRYFTDWFSSWEQNDQLGIDSRTSLGAGFGRYIVQTNRNHFSLMAGAQATRSEFKGEDPGDTLGEGRFQIRFLHRNLKPETNITFTQNFFPVLEDFSNYRVETSLILDREIIKDLDFRIDIFHKYQSEPPTDGEQTDKGVVTSLVYSW